MKTPAKLIRPHPAVFSSQEGGLRRGFSTGRAILPIASQTWHFKLILQREEDCGCGRSPIAPVLIKRCTKLEHLDPHLKRSVGHPSWRHELSSRASGAQPQERQAGALLHSEPSLMCDIAERPTSLQQTNSC